MGIKNVYDVAARAMSAQLVRMNAIASNLANANNVTGDKESVYKPLRPVFKTVYSDKLKSTGLSTVEAVKVERLNREPIKKSSVTFFVASIVPLESTSSLPEVSKLLLDMVTPIATSAYDIAGAKNSAREADNINKYFFILPLYISC